MKKLYKLFLVLLGMVMCVFAVGCDAGVGFDETSQLFVSSSGLSTDSDSVPNSLPPNDEVSSSDFVFEEVGPPSILSIGSPEMLLEYIQGLETRDEAVLKAFRLAVMPAKSKLSESDIVEIQEFFQRLLSVETFIATKDNALERISATYYDYDEWEWLVIHQTFDGVHYSFQLVLGETEPNIYNETPVIENAAIGPYQFSVYESEKWYSASFVGASGVWQIRIYADNPESISFDWLEPVTFKDGMLWHCSTEEDVPQN